MGRVSISEILEHKYLWAYGIPLLFVLLWSAGFTFAKMGMVHTGPFTLLALRYTLVIMVLLPCYLVLRPSLPQSGIDWLHQAMVGFFIQVVYFGCVYAAISKGVSASGMGLIFSLQPILVGLFAPLLTGEQINRKCWFGLLLGLSGTALVILGRSSVEVASALAYSIAICAVLGMTSATIYEKKFGIPWHPVVANLVQCSVGLVVALPAGYWFEGLQVTWGTELYIALLYLVGCNSLAAITLLLAMIRRGEATRVSALFFLVPPMAALIAWGLLDEIIPPLAWLGMGVAAFGVAIVTRSKNPVH